MNRIALCVDLDGTLVRTDTMLESLLLFCKQHPLQLWRLPLWLLGGKARFKKTLAQHATPIPATLPLHQPLLDWLRQQKSQGRSLVLATASDLRTAQAVGVHFGIFDEIIASDGSHNLASEHKRRRLVERFGERGYDYAGNAAADLAVWRSARAAIVVGSERLKSKASRVTKVVMHFPPDHGHHTGVLWLRALRLHQWVKNLLIFVPLLLGQQLAQTARLDHAGLAFLAFGFCASAVYLLNDLFDLEADRAHARKRHRPFASGQLSLLAGLLAAPALLIAAFALASWLTPAFAALLGLYFLCTLAYSIRLKRVPMLDVLILAGLYTSRVIAGGLSTGIELSFWLLAFSAFLFLSLAIVKRDTELTQLIGTDQAAMPGRGYHTSDLPLLRSVGVASGFGAVLVLALYINSPQSQLLYSHGKVLWALCPLLLLWLSRMWLLTHRGRMHDDPIVFALRDRVSLAIGALFVSAILLAG